jgi:hypothetical protein
MRGDQAGTLSLLTGWLELYMARASSVQRQLPPTLKIW